MISKAPSLEGKCSTGKPPWADLAPAFPLIRLAQFCADSGLTQSTVYEMIAEGTFPKPIKIGPRAVAWPRAWIDAWMNWRAEESRQPSPARKLKPGRRRAV